VLSGATITLYAYSKYVEETRVRKKERRKELGI
jgi:hypothetical protein